MDKPLRSFIVHNSLFTIQSQRPPVGNYRQKIVDVSATSDKNLGTGAAAGPVRMSESFLAAFDYLPKSQNFLILLEGKGAV
jgi:hypothetical protein